MTKQLTALACAALTLATVSASFAVDKMGGSMMSHSTMMHSKKMSHGTMKTVAYCAKCKMYTSVSAGKKMHMMDPMGHKMMITPMSHVPKDATMIPSGGKMDKMKM